MNIEDSKYCCR